MQLHINNPPDASYVRETEDVLPENRYAPAPWGKHLQEAEQIEITVNDIIYARGCQFEAALTSGETHQGAVTLIQNT